MRREPKRYYYWNLGIHDGKRSVMGPYLSEEIATEKGLMNFSGDFKTYKLTTINEARAKRQLKAALTDEGFSFGEAIKPMTHKQGGKAICEDVDIFAEKEITL